MALIGNLEVNGTAVDGIVVVDKVFGGKQEGYYRAVAHVFFGPRFRRAGLRVADFNVDVPYLEGEDPVRMAYHAIKAKHPDLVADQGVVAASPDLAHYLKTSEKPATVVAAPVVEEDPMVPGFDPDGVYDEAKRVVEEIQAAPVEKKPGLIRRLMFWSK